MSYIATDTRVSTLSIGGVDYTSQLIEWEVSDSSAYKNGCIQTEGNVVIGTASGGNIEDYDRNNFRRGMEVLLYTTEPGGSPVLHPRGRLYVVTSYYDVESETITIDIACRLTLLSLTENASDDKLDDLKALVPIALDTAQSTYSNCCAAFASVGEYVYQDNAGTLQTGEFWDGDTNSSTAPGEWLSVLGVTAASVSPLAGGEAIPDEVKISYQVPTGGLAQDNTGRVDTVETTSYYFFQYPAITYQRQNKNANTVNQNGSLSSITGVTSEPASTGSTSSCGNAPSKPDGGGGSCNGGYVVVQTPVFVPAIRRVVRVTKYEGPGAQVSEVTTTTYGPKVEANGQYFADNYAYCRQTWATACNPNGNCPMEGLDEIKLTESIQTNTYGTANELTGSITDSYATKLSAAQPTDWRAGNVSGEIQDFDPDLATSGTAMFRVSRVEVAYTKEQNANVQTTTTYQSLSSRQVGITGGFDLDAVTGGIQTKEIQRSSTITTLGVQPNILNNSTTDTKELSTTEVLYFNRFDDPPQEAGPYVLEEQIPMPLLFTDQSDIDDAVQKYTNYLIRFIKGDSYGLQIGESYRSDVASGWRPGMPFRYYDQKKNVLLAMRMDATSWGVSQEGAAFVTNGVWNGVSNGTVTIPSNTVGGSSPDMTAATSGVTNQGSGSGTPSAPPAANPGGVQGETNVMSGPFIRNIDVHFGFKGEANTFSQDGVGPQPPSDPFTCNGDITTTCFVSGLIATAGSLLEIVNPDGSLPADYLGSLVAVGGTVVNSDLFA